MEVLIVSKTYMSNAACVGGLVLENNRYVRLLNRGNHNQPTDTDLSVGGIWEINFIDRNPTNPPHIEDVIILNKKFIRNIDGITALLTERNVIDWNGHINNLFDVSLNWTNSGTGYIPADGQIPEKSVGFWVADKDLTKNEFNGIRYNYPDSDGRRSLKFVGFDTPINVIPAGTILRVSLARWWKQDENTEKRCYLQLSGWYLNGQQQDGPTPQINDDLPF